MYMKQKRNIPFSTDKGRGIKDQKETMNTRTQKKKFNGKTEEKKKNEEESKCEGTENSCFVSTGNKLKCLQNAKHEKESYTSYVSST